MDNNAKSWSNNDSLIIQGYTFWKIMVAIDTLKFDNEMNAFVINTNIVLHYVFFLKYLCLLYH